MMNTLNSLGKGMKKIEKKKKRYWNHLPYMRKCNSGKSSPGVEQEPKRIERAHSGTRKLHRYLNFDERIHQWEVSSISSENSFLFSTFTL